MGWGFLNPSPTQVGIVTGWIFCRSMHSPIAFMSSCACNGPFIFRKYCFTAVLPTSGSCLSSFSSAMIPQFRGEGVWCRCPIKGWTFQVISLFCFLVAWSESSLNKETSVSECQVYREAVSSSGWELAWVLPGYTSPWLNGLGEDI